MPTCNGCGFTGDGDDFDAAFSAYHDLRCPKCGTTNIDTSDAPKGYGFGNHNTLDTSNESR